MDFFSTSKKFVINFNEIERTCQNAINGVNEAPLKKQYQKFEKNVMIFFNVQGTLYSNLMTWKQLASN